MLDYYQKAKAHFIASHQHPVNQAMHHTSNLLAIAAIAFLFVDWRWTLGCLVLTQVFALGGHYWVEKNQPAAIQYPIITILASLSWSFDRWFGLRDWLQHQLKQTPPT